MSFNEQQASISSNARRSNMISIGKSGIYKINML